MVNFTQLPTYTVVSMTKSNRSTKSGKTVARGGVTFPERVWEKLPDGAWSSRPSSELDLLEREKVCQILSREPDYGRAYAAPVQTRVIRHKAAA